MQFRPFRNRYYLVVWVEVPAYAGTSVEVFGQRLDANGYEVGADDFKISHAISSVSADYIARDPSVALSASANEYLVVWSGDPDALGDREIYGTRLSAGGSVLGGGNFLISEREIEEDHNFDDAYYPAVAWNSDMNEFLVVWLGGDASLVGDDYEIFGQRLAYVPAPTPTLTNPRSDINGDGSVDAEDLMILLQEWERP